MSQSFDGGLGRSRNLLGAILTFLRYVGRNLSRSLDIVLMGPQRPYTLPCLALICLRTHVVDTMVGCSCPPSQVRFQLWLNWRDIDGGVPKGSRTGTTQHNNWWRRVSPLCKFKSIPEAHIFSLSGIVLCNDPAERGSKLQPRPELHLEKILILGANRGWNRDAVGV